MILLDTHAWLWFLEGTTLPSRLRARLIEERFGISAISLWEIGNLVERNRIDLPRPLVPWWEKSVANSTTHVFPIDAETVAHVPFHWSHRDPADRFIVATALRHNLPLATRDATIRGCGICRTIW